MNYTLSLRLYSNLRVIDQFRMCTSSYSEVWKQIEKHKKLGFHGFLFSQNARSIIYSF